MSAANTIKLEGLVLYHAAAVIMRLSAWEERFRPSQRVISSADEAVFASVMMDWLGQRGRLEMLQRTGDDLKSGRSRYAIISYAARAADVRLSWGRTLPEALANMVVTVQVAGPGFRAGASSGPR